MIFVSATSPLNYLVLIEQIECLPRLFVLVLEALARLRTTPFRLAAHLEPFFLERDRQRREQPSAPPPPCPGNPHNGQP